MSRVLRIGTRKSNLALWQAKWCAARLSEHGFQVELVHLVTQGDVTKGSLAQAGGQGLFTKRIQQALFDQEADLAVHSLKDLPTDPTPGLRLAAVPEREIPNDVMVSHQANTLMELPAGAVVGTGSIRRQAQVLFARPDCQVADIRGNVETRLEKLDAGEYDAIVLARAGMHRLGLSDRMTEVIDSETMMPAVGQGALGIEVRGDDEESLKAARLLIHEPSMQAVTAERALLRSLRAGCLAPVGCLATVDEHSQLTLKATVLDSQGKQRLVETVSGEAAQAESIGISAADALLHQGAAELIAQSRPQ